MPRARKHLVCLDTTPYYHIVSRCVRRAFLCGVDRTTSKSYEHRRIWIEDRARVLSSLFAIEICAYAIMSNHYHLVVKVVAKEADSWTDDDVLTRWTSLFKGPRLVQMYQAGEPLSNIQLQTIRSFAGVYRARLTSLSWFMKCLNEPIARQANSEDGCTGHFWEARFRSQALRSEQALLTAMAYVDLNPIRAGIAKTPETSVHTSIQARIDPDSASARLKTGVADMLGRHELRHPPAQTRPLAAFANKKVIAINRDCIASTLPMRWLDYLELVDTTGRVAVLGKRGRIDPTLKPVLERLSMTSENWFSATTRFGEHYRNGELRLAKAS